MSSQYDVQFRVNAGDYKGTVYRYTLASKGGAKIWEVNPKFRPAPTMIKEEIKMVIVAREKNIPRSGAVELRMVNQIIDELSIIADETNVTLTGLDHQERPILIDREGFSVTSTADEKTLAPEFRITVTCWGLHK